MGLASSIRSAVKGIKAAVGDVADVVLHQAQDGINVDAEQGAGESVERRAVVEYRRKIMNSGDRTEVSTARLTFIEPVAVAMGDRFTLPNGTTGPVIAIGGVTDSGNVEGLLFVTTVELGEVR